MKLKTERRFPTRYKNFPGNLNRDTTENFNFFCLSYQRITRIDVAFHTIQYFLFIKFTNAHEFIKVHINVN